MLSSFQERQRFGEREPALYAHLATRLAFVAVLGADLDPAPAATVRGGALPLDDLLRSEWNVVVLGPHFSAALVALDLGDSGPYLDRRFDSRSPMIGPSSFPPPAR